MFPGFGNCRFLWGTQLPTKAWKGDESLKNACKVYLKGYPLLVPTSMRDFWETKLHHDDGEIASRITM